jgi:histidine triad (HIT) family protein
MMNDDCIFCKLANGVIPVEGLYEDDVVKVILDASPAALGHALILPKSHAENVYRLDDEVVAHVAKVAKKIAWALKLAVGADGINVLQNNEEAAGQTVMHYHVHVIPRYNGDSVNVSWTPKDDNHAEEILAKVKKCL